jgi:hypothetical protein
MGLAVIGKPGRAETAEYKHKKLGIVAKGHH